MEYKIKIWWDKLSQEERDLLIEYLYKLKLPMLFKTGKYGNYNEVR